MASPRTIEEYEQQLFGQAPAGRTGQPRPSRAISARPRSAATIDEYEAQLFGTPPTPPTPPPPGLGRRLREWGEVATRPVRRAAEAGGRSLVEAGRAAVGEGKTEGPVEAMTSFPGRAIRSLGHLLGAPLAAGGALLETPFEGLEAFERRPPGMPSPKELIGGSGNRSGWRCRFRCVVPRPRRCEKPVSLARSSGGPGRGRGNCALNWHQK